MDSKKGGEGGFSGTGRFVKVIPKRVMTQANLTRVHEALSSAADQTGAFRSATSGRYGARKLPPSKTK